MAKRISVKRLLIITGIIVVLFVAGNLYVISRSPLFGPTPDEIALEDFHYLNIALDGYFSKHDGDFPAYLLGGDKEGWEYYNANRPAGAPYICDPLIEGGYLDSYPENPYFNIKKWGYEEDKKAFSEFLAMIRGPDGKSFDPRFGLKGNKMGNVLVEPYYVLTAVGDVPDGYPRMCPGQFYYKSYAPVYVHGSIFSNDEGSFGSGWPKVFPNVQSFSWRAVDINTPDDFDFDNQYGYVLGLFGTMVRPGKDTIRWVDMSGAVPDEFPYISPVDKYANPEGADIDVYLRLPEVYGDGDASTPPYWLPWCDDKGGLTAPDGISDGVIYTFFNSSCTMRFTTLIIRPVD
jgi:hypothetical protein